MFHKKFISSYLLKYKSDDSFDNTDVDRSLRYLWENENYEELTPLRNWEKEETKGILLCRQTFFPSEMTIFYTFTN